MLSFVKADCTRRMDTASQAHRMADVTAISGALACAPGSTNTATKPTRTATAGPRLRKRPLRMTHKARSRLDPYQDTPPKPGKGRKVGK